MLKLIYKRYLAAGGDLDFWSFQKPNGGLVALAIVDDEPVITFWDEALDALNVTQPTVAELLDALNAAPALEEARDYVLATLQACCGAAIVGDYDSDALGSVHTYPSDVTAQLNMMGSVTDALIPSNPEGWTTPFWCADASGVWAFRAHTASQIIAAGRAGKAHVVACQTKLDTLTQQLMAAETLEDITAISWTGDAE
ncbi:DUF4376 domain-containing protein [Agrobacterium sp. LMR679]|uniref:DUF4376 domain-containing protein n=1 Tax=Agrobacterium sp. LMR679 TaxID=3014335 RepID=UPI0022AEEC58|nr:hypothetical protein [Agrobacterium sp. LMR679]MCZ4072712.1 hypothetical protein [Agrobacterium sp. LMR679]